MSSVVVEGIDHDVFPQISLFRLGVSGEEPVAVAVGATRTIQVRVLFCVGRVDDCRRTR